MCFVNNINVWAQLRFFNRLFIKYFKTSPIFWLIIYRKLLEKMWHTMMNMFFHNLRIKSTEISATFSSNGPFQTTERWNISEKPQKAAYFWGRNTCFLISWAKFGQKLCVYLDKGIFMRIWGAQEGSKDVRLPLI